MMLHEAVMLEIYRQALNASEMASPRCQSRDSSGRCPSNESEYSGRGGPTISPGSMPPSGLLPQHSAAMAAYLNAAAAAAHQNRMLLASPHMQRGRSPSPENDGGILDFSKKGNMSNDSDSNEESDGEVQNLSKMDNSPLDLSCSRKRSNESSNHSPRKMSRHADLKQNVISPWTSPVTPQLPFFAAAVAAAGISPKNLNSLNSLNALNSDWNGKKMSSMPNDATKALEKMADLSRIGGDDMFRPTNHNNSQSSSNSNNNNAGVSLGGSTGRHSAWQSHWLNKGADSAKDVLKCVWCKQSFPSLAAMTTHMKETKHCGVSMPPQNQNQAQSPMQAGSSHSNHNHAAAKSNSSDLNLLIKETMPLPRKLVRGQDVWLGKGAEQTRQILKCMWCGQSFRSLSDMTTHMQQTQHYTNIISQEQIISWKTGSNSGSPNDSTPAEKGAPSAQPTPPTNSAAVAAANAASNNSHVSAVLTCKVCDQAFTSLKELSNHMVKNAHYKEHIMRSITESGSRRRQTREKRKKSLPVRKLLELERAQHDFKNGENNPLNNKPIRDLSAGRITCEKCSEKIDTALFVDHIRQCIGNTNSAQKLKSALLSNSIIPPDSLSPVTPNSRDGRKSDSDMTSPGSMRQRSPTSASSLDLSGKKESSGDKTNSPSVLNALEMLIEKSFDTRSRHGQQNFSNVSQSSTPLGASILKRLGIDESVDYTKPLVDSQTMSLLRNYHSQQNYMAAHYGRRERSGSESSSISERGSSRVDSLTPEKKFDISGVTRVSPEKYHQDSEDERPMKIKTELQDGDDIQEKLKHAKSQNFRIKREVEDDDEAPIKQRKHSNETNDESDDDRPLKLIKLSNLTNNRSPQASPAPSRHASSVPISPATSPISDHHSSIASRSTPGGDKKPSSSLGALSSMFDNLGSVEKPSTENGQKRTSAHPLAALQKLCDKNETNPSRSASQSNTLLSASPSLQNSSRTAPGAMLAFSWACNDAMNSEDSNLKCAYCDTTFNSKGAYRHHLSKAHFVNDDVIPDPIAVKSHAKLHPPQSPKSPHSPKTNSNAGGNGNGVAHKKSPSPSAPANNANIKTEATAGFDESPHSKFLKYTELAKQLSSKYV